jgi:NADP-dependent 3-hydroxy acid dehydrogenase YdfG
MPTDKQRVVMISGSRRGIGAAIAKRLLAEGYAVSLGVRHPEDGGWWQHLDRDEGNVLVHDYEATDIGAGTSWVCETSDHFGRIDALVNDAGIMRTVTLEEEDESAYAELWNVNVMAPLRVTRAAFPFLKATGNGRVINIASLAGKRVRGDQVGYAMTKHAMLALTHSIRRSGWEYGIRATAICPGMVATDMTSQSKSLKALEMIQPEDVAQIVQTVLTLPNTAAIAEVLVNCRFEDTM